MKKRFGILATPAVLAAGAIALTTVGASGPAATADPPPTLDLADVLDQRVSAAGTAEGSCFSRVRSGQGVVTREIRVPAGIGQVRAVLDGGQGDWDVAVFDAAGDALAAGSSSRADEVASGWTLTGGTLTVQACRLSGPSQSARLTVEHAPLPADARNAARGIQVVDVHTPTRMDKNRLTSMGFDLTGHASRGHLGVMLHGPADEARLREAGFTWRVRNADVVGTDLRARREERRYAAGTSRSALPSGRTTYRRLFEYQQEMKALAEQNPGIVRLVTLPNRTWEGRVVEGVEISTNVNQADGKPVFLQMGVHHAREWPSGEHAIEWAYELVNGYRNGDARPRRIVEQTRTIVVPIVNPDGFEISRETGRANGADNGRETDPETGNVVAIPYEYQRKNCRLLNDAESGNCRQPGTGIVQAGVDPNRNYGGFWGGVGASNNPATQTYYGPGPFSEPETRNVRAIVSSRHVVTLISNHTFSGLVLRPPGLASQGTTVDEEVYRQLGDAMAAENGYLSLYSYQLYDTTGTTEDWSYYATGGLGFTFEIGCDVLDRDPEARTCNDGHFHPAFPDVVAEWEGTSSIADDIGPGRGNREAYYIASESTANPARHAVLEGEAPPGTRLRLRKTFQTPTSQRNADGSVRSFEDALDTVMDVGGDGRVEWHVNPSTRPLVARDSGRPARGEPSPPVEFSGGPPASAPCANYDSPPPSCDEVHEFTIPTGAGIDNAFAAVRIEWATEASDWDLKVFRDTNDSGSLDSGDELVGTSGQGITDFEETVLGPDPAPGRYFAQVINYAAAEPYEGTVTFRGPGEFTPARVEAYTLTCERDGRVLGSQQVVVNRGERRRLDLSACRSTSAPTTTTTTTTTPPRTTTATGPTCRAGGGFRSVGARRSGRRGVRFEFNRRVDAPVTLDVFQQSVGRRVVGERLIARFTGRTQSFTWNGRANRRGRRTGDGYYFARYRIRTPDGETDVRRVTLQRVNGRWRTRPSFYRRATCDALPSFKLERPVFGGRTSRALGISFRVAEASRVRVTVLRGSRVVRTYQSANRRSGVTHRLRLRPEPLPRGDYQVRIEVTQGGRTLRTSLTSRRL